MPEIDGAYFPDLYRYGLGIQPASIAAAGINQWRHSYVFGRAATYGTELRNGEAPLYRLDWLKSGIPLTDGHDGQMIGTSEWAEETRDGLNVLWKIGPGWDAVNRVLERIDDGTSDLSPGYFASAPGSSSGQLHEVSIVKRGKIPGAEVLAVLTPDVYYARRNGRLEVDRPGAYIAELAVRAHEETLPASTSTRAAETYTAPLEVLELRQADGRHLIDMRIIPYNTITRRVPKPERIAPHAFAGAVAAAPSIQLRDYNHDRTRRPAGHFTHIEDRPDALYGTAVFNETPTGREAYEEAKASTYSGCSVEFRALAEHQVGGIREITSARLHAVALVDDPAYQDAAILRVD